MQYAPILLIHYIKAESSTTDNMYRNKEIIIANTIAANRTYKLSYTLYKDSCLKQNVIELSDMFYNITCRYLFGLFCSIKTKKDIIKLIEIRKSKYRLVNYAINYPTIYAIITNCASPLFRIARIIHRKRTAKKLQK